MIIPRSRRTEDYHKLLPDLIISFEIELIRNSIRVYRPRWLVFLYAMMSHAEPDFCLSASRLSFLSVTGMLFKELCARRLLSAGENEYITAYIFCQHFLKFFFIFFRFFPAIFFASPCGRRTPLPGREPPAQREAQARAAGDARDATTAMAGPSRPGRGCRTAMEPWPSASARVRAPRATERRNSGSTRICAIKKPHHYPARLYN